MQREMLEKLMEFCEYHRAQILNIDLENNKAEVLAITKWKRPLIFINGEWDVEENK